MLRTVAATFDSACIFTLTPNIRADPPGTDFKSVPGRAVAPKFLGTDFKSVPGRCGALKFLGTDFKSVPGRAGTPKFLGTDFKSVPGGSGRSGRSGILSHTVFIIFIHVFGNVTPVWPWYFPFLSR